MKYIFIVNPIAGNDDKIKIFSKIKSTFRLIDDEMILEETSAKGDAKSIASFYAEKYADECVIVSCGGDGTVHEIANGLAATDTPMMILPLGTGNDFAKKIYGTKKINVENVIKAFGLYNGKIKYDVKPIDLIDYNGEKCINVMSYGLDTKVETIGRKIAAKVPALGHQAYNVAIIPVLCQSMKYQLNIDLNCIDENNNPYKITETPIDYTLFAVCNASYYGGGFCPAPNARLDDGLLDFALVEPVNAVQALPLIPKYSKGDIEGIKQLRKGYVVSGRISSTDGSPLIGNCDGENFDYSEVNFKVEKKSLKLCFIKD
ncbi:MAG: diacylglycerol/lipid kinase family protein [Eubacterium sp.]